MKGKTMKNKTLALILSAVLLSGVLSCCSELNQKAEQYSSNKEECFLNTDNVTQFTYKEKCYTILDDTVTKEDLGSWVGYIRKLAVMDKKGKILLQQDTEKTTFKTLADIADKEPNAFAIIPFLNIYEPKDSTEKGLIVDANGGYHKAMLYDSVTDADNIFDYSKQQSVTSDGEFSVNPQDCTQLIMADKVYQITDKAVPDNQLGEYLDVIAQSIVIDKETKLEILKEDLLKMDLDGKGSSKQQRESWVYGEVRTIQNTDVSNSVAVEINSKYWIATCQ
jgi:hypothetical protein